MAAVFPNPTHLAVHPFFHSAVFAEVPIDVMRIQSQVSERWMLDSLTTYLNLFFAFAEMLLENWYSWVRIKMSRIIVIYSYWIWCWLFSSWRDFVFSWRWNLSSCCLANFLPLLLRLVFKDFLLHYYYSGIICLILTLCIKGREQAWECFLKILL